MSCGPQLTNFLPLAQETGTTPWVTVRVTICTQTPPAIFSHLSPAKSSFQASATSQSLVSMVLFRCQSHRTSPSMPCRCHLVPCTHGTRLNRQLKSFPWWITLLQHPPMLQVCGLQNNRNSLFPPNLMIFPAHPRDPPKWNEVI